MLGGEQRELTAQRFGTVDGDERLVAILLIGAQGPVPLPFPGDVQKRSDSARPEERQVGGEHENPVRRGPPDPASSAANGPPPWGSSRVQITGRTVARRPPTTTVVEASAQAASTRSSSARPPTRIPGLSAPPSRLAAPPARTMASYTVMRPSMRAVVSC